MSEDWLEKELEDLYRRKNEGLISAEEFADEFHEIHQAKRDEQCERAEREAAYNLEY